MTLHVCPFGTHHHLVIFKKKKQTTNDPEQVNCDCEVCDEREFQTLPVLKNRTNKNDIWLY